MRRVHAAAREPKPFPWRTLTVASVTALLAACGASKPQPTGGPENSNTANNQASANKYLPAADFSWGARVMLTSNTYGKWNPDTAEPVQGESLQGTSKYLLVVDDGRFNYPADPNPNDPNADAPTGLYTSATQQSQPVTTVPDGTVLKVIGWTENGQQISDAHGGQGYPVWEKVIGHDGATAWVPWVNVGYTDLQELNQLPKS